MNWFRLYHTVLTDDKIQRLPIELRWHWIELLCLASQEKNRGTLPKFEVISFYMRVKKSKVKKIIDALIEAGLVERIAGEKPDDSKGQSTQCDDAKGFVMHNWEERQRKSDVSNERVQRYRERIGNGDVTLQKRSARPPAGSRSEKEKEETPPTPSEGVPLATVPNLGPEYAIVGELAMQLGGDVSWGMWVSRMGHFGFEASWIKHALEKASAKNTLKQAYVYGILKRYQGQGCPDPESSTNGPTGSVKPEAKIEFHREPSSTCRCPACTPANGLTPKGTP